MKSLFVATLLAIALVSTNAASGCIAYFGYTGSDCSTTNTGSDCSAINAITTAVSVSTGHIAVKNPYDYIVADVEYIKAKAGPVFIDIAPLIFDSNTSSGIDCTHYQRGGNALLTLPFYKLLGDFRSRLDTFFSINEKLFQGDLKVIALVIHSEVNNHCVEHWKINTATAYVKQKLNLPGYIQPRLAIGYGLTNTPGQISKGLPVNSDDSIAKFPFQPTTIGYWAYDIFDPNNIEHTKNINAEKWDVISNKIDQALRSHQKTVGVFKANCNPGGFSETAWGIGCPNQAIWKLGVLSNAWRDYWLNDPRNEAVLAFGWTNGPPPSYQTDSLPQIWDEHSAINDARNCTMTFPQLE